MKLAEALMLRADCQKRIAQLKARLLTNAKVQEGDAASNELYGALTHKKRKKGDALQALSIDDGNITLL